LKNKESGRQGIRKIRNQEDKELGRSGIGKIRKIRNQEDKESGR
jgi:hypothetical protein